MILLQYVRIAIISIVCLASALLLFFVLFQSIVAPLIVLVAPTWEPFFYDLALYGAYRVRSYRSFNLTSPGLSHNRWSDRCDDGYVFLTPKGESVPHFGPTVIDSDGNLIWMSNTYKTATNLKVQEFKGKQYLTFWSGKQSGTAGAGEYYMLDESYNVARTITPVGVNVFGDLHEFRITNEGTALMTVYNKTTMDMRDIGRPEKGWILDSIFQEVDIETGDLLFEWRASEHYTASESYMTHPFAGYTSWIPFDFFHINSVEKDSRGNYLISSRHMHTMTYIDGKTGDIIWIMGGKRNMFQDISGGMAIDFSWQHDARWLSREDGIMTIFDNRQGGILHTWGPFSRGLMLQIDETKWTAKLLQHYESLQHTLVPSQGSVEILPGSGNVFIGWGHSAAFSEFSADGSLLCETHFGASALYFFGRATSYRAYKTKQWVGKPMYPPSVTIEDGMLYVSWNGATKVGAWQLEGQGLDDTEYRALDVIEKRGFEEVFILANPESYARYRVAALNEDWQVFAHSDEVENVPDSSVFGMVFKIVVGCIFAVFGWQCWRRFIRPRLGRPFKWMAYEYRKV